MSKKHFIALALELKHVRPVTLSQHPTAIALRAVQDETWTLCVRAVANACERHALAFDRKRFIDACEEGVR